MDVISRVKFNPTRLSLTVDRTKLVTSANYTVDPASGLPITSVPPTLRSAFGDLDRGVIHFIEEVDKVSTYTKRTRRILIITDRVLFLTHLDGKPTRCVPIIHIELALADTNSGALLFRVPSEHDIMITTNYQQISAIGFILPTLIKTLVGRKFVFTHHHGLLSDAFSATHTLSVRLRKSPNFSLKLYAISSFEDIVAREEQRKAIERMVAAEEGREAADDATAKLRYALGVEAAAHTADVSDLQSLIECLRSTITKLEGSIAGWMGQANVANERADAAEDRAAALIRSTTRPPPPPRDNALDALLIAATSSRRYLLQGGAGVAAATAGADNSFVDGTYFVSSDDNDDDYDVSYRSVKAGTCPRVGTARLQKKGDESVDDHGTRPARLIRNPAAARDCWLRAFPPKGSGGLSTSVRHARGLSEARTLQFSEASMEPAILDADPRFSIVDSYASPRTSPPVASPKFPPQSPAQALDLDHSMSQPRLNAEDFPSDTEYRPPVEPSSSAHPQSFAASAAFKAKQIDVPSGTSASQLSTAVNSPPPRHGAGSLGWLEQSRSKSRASVPADTRRASVPADTHHAADARSPPSKLPPSDGSVPMEPVRQHSSRSSQPRPNVVHSPDPPMD